MAQAFIQGTAKVKLSTQKITPQLLSEIEAALHLVRNYGSIEIYVQNSIVTQITVRNIKKTQVGLTGT
ncbi:hypothetical protein A3A79_00355 [Candidatus Gottesmanbacteria bacterium RIFCSPLOWO2_01_FULL_43_11b]|uniref:DUF2292 domain-containing protein n=1 Tax=Candidatus Gottesmanbacteria bacterium RIFCSPLOWO2_01_FULL_43_11b TaxID=1798392 RepID=A0A1F6AG48_9BACT|nr:MAG: hypothetical protein A3A79_00355 [Candidatus Gottesmanbacteria bacterium RIFCSPLOWO2_01_FULL_43_11b]